MLAIYDVATTKLQVWHKGERHEFTIEEMDEWNSIVNSEDDAFDIQLWGDDYISGEFPTCDGFEYGFQYTKLDWVEEDDNWNVGKHDYNRGQLVLTKNGEMVKEIKTGILKGDELVCSETGEVLDYSSLLNVKFEGVWIEVFRSTEDEGTETIHNCDTLSEAITFMSTYECDEDETIFTDFWCDPENPSKVDFSNGNLEGIKTFLKESCK